MTNPELIDELQQLLQDAQRLQDEARTLPKRRARVVRRLRARGWTFQKIGDTVGVSRQRVQQWELEG